MKSSNWLQSTLTNTILQLVIASGGFLVGMLWHDLSSLTKVYIWPQMPRELAIHTLQTISLIAIFLLAFVFYLTYKVWRFNHPKYEFLNGILWDAKNKNFHCPNCLKLAKIVPGLGEPGFNVFTTSRFVCCSCTYVHYPLSEDGSSMDPYKMLVDLTKPSQPITRK